MKVSSSMLASNGHTISVELSEDDVDLSASVSVVERYKKLSQMADLLLIDRFKRSGELPESFADQIAANAVK